jgi:hypothetical protein
MSVVKTLTTANFSTNQTVFDGQGAYSPSQADIYAVDPTGMVLTAVFNGVTINFNGPLYDVNHTGTKGAGWYFGIQN